MADLTGPGEPGEPGGGEPSDDATHAVVEHWVDESGATVVRLVGELDVSNIQSVRVAMEPALRRSPDRLVFDLTGLDFMDSSGIAVMLEAAGRARSVALRNPTPVIRRIVESTGLEQILAIEP